MNARFTSAAHADLREALAWYRQRGQRLDRRFLAAVDAAVETLMDHPELGRVIEGEVRRYLLRGFPFALFYVPSDDEIVVLACLHGASDPNTWPSSGAA